MSDEQDRAERFDEEVVGDPTVDEREQPEDEALGEGSAPGGRDGDEDPLLVELRAAALLDELEERAHRADEHAGLDPATLRLAHDAGLDDDPGDEARDAWRASHPPRP